MGMCPPLNYQQLWNAVEQVGYKGSEKISKMDMFNLFKEVQGVKRGKLNNVDWGRSKQ